MASGAGILVESVTVIDQPVAIADDLTSKQGTARVYDALKGQAACLYGCVWWWGKTPVIVVSVCGACVFVLICVLGLSGISLWAWGHHGHLGVLLVLCWAWVYSVVSLAACSP